MNTAYKNFLNDALYDYCKANGIDLGDLIDHIEFRAAHPFTVSDGNGGKRTVSEPSAFEYSDAAGTYIITSLDRNSLETRTSSEPARTPASTSKMSSATDTVRRRIASVSSVAPPLYTPSGAIRFPYRCLPV